MAQDEGMVFHIVELFLLCLVAFWGSDPIHALVFICTCIVCATAFPSIVILLTSREASRITYGRKGSFQKPAVSFSICLVLSVICCPQAYSVVIVIVASPVSTHAGGMKQKLETDD